MAVGLDDVPELLPVLGIRLGATSAGIYRSARDDLALVEIEADSHCAGVFTRNAFCAAPVTIARTHLAAASQRYLLINSGNANAGTGAQGLHDAVACCKAVAERARCRPEQVLPFSTGVIGEPIPVQRIHDALPTVFESLDEANWLAAARAIMTTDTVPKGVSHRVRAPGGAYTVTGICKGSGMIRPDMATMLAFIGTDARVSHGVLQRCLARAMDSSFNRVTVDGDTSTNDACVLIATGMSDVLIEDTGQAQDGFVAVLNDVCATLAQALIRDAEGATKFITVRVEAARDEAECLQVAYTLAHSPLVKTAFFASDPNWGRILAAVGRAGVSNLEIEQVDIFLDEVCIVKSGARCNHYTEEHGQRVMARDEITVRVVLGRGSCEASVWTSDLSHDYVRINAEYRT